MFCCAIWSLVDHLLSWLLKRTSSFVVQLLLLSHCSRAVGLSHLLLLCWLSAISTRTWVHSRSVVGCVHYRTSSGNWLFLCNDSLVSRCCSSWLLRAILKKNTEIWLSAIWFEIKQLRETSQKLAASLLIYQSLKLSFFATYFILLCLWGSLFNWLLSVNNV